MSADFWGDESAATPVLLRSLVRASAGRCPHERTHRYDAIARLAGVRAPRAFWLKCTVWIAIECDSITSATIQNNRQNDRRVDSCCPLFSNTHEGSHKKRPTLVVALWTNSKFLFQYFTEL